MSQKLRASTPLRRGCTRLPTLLALVAFAAFASSGCATYSDKMAKVMTTTTMGDYQGSITSIDKLMDVDQPGQLPEKFESETALGLLERGTLGQAIFDYKGSSRDFIAADAELQLLDLSDDTVGSIGKYIYSDSSTKYVSTPTEKLCVNSYNMMNFLAQGDLAGARVEARRFTVMQNYLESTDIDGVHIAIGSYLAGFTFEMLGEWQSSMRYYEEALQSRSLDSLSAPIHRLAPMTSYRGKNLTRVLGEAPVDPNEAARTEDPKLADLLVIVSVGRVPYKIPERMPIGMAVGVAGSWISGNPEVLGHTAMKFINYPKLVQSGSIFGKVALRVDDRPASLELASNLGKEITSEYEAIKPRIIGAAVSRMIVRAAVAEGVRQAGNQQSEGLGWALALLTEATMVAADKPDTRSWMHLPEKVYVYRQRIPAGQHAVDVIFGANDGDTISREVTLAPGGFATVVVTAPR